MNRVGRTGVLLIGPFVLLLTSPVSSQVALSGFVDELVVSGLNMPTGFTFLPDGRILIAQKSGIVRLVKNGVLQTTPFIDLRARVNDYWDRGLLGIAAHTDFATNGNVYLYYVYENNANDYSGPKTARLTRVTAVGDAASPSTETVVVGSLSGASCGGYPPGSDCIPADSPSHNGGTIRVTSDGTLFLSTGDGASFTVVDDLALRAQNLDSLAGKILRMTTSGQGVSDNPFWDGNPASVRSKVWAYGLRNPFRFSLRPATSQPYVGDVGWSLYEEIDVAKRGANLGWPCYEGFDQQSSYASKLTCQSLFAAGPAAVQMPLISWAHNGTGAAALGGTYYTGTSFPTQFQAAYFYGDYARGTLGYLHADVNDNLTGGPAGFASGLQGPVEIKMGPDGNLYYLAINTNELHRIRYEGSGTSVQYVSDLTWTSMTNGWGPAERDRSNGETGATDGHQLRLNGVTYAKGLGVHAVSDIRYAIPAGCTQFVADVGVDDEVGTNGSVIFQVWADTVKLFESGTLGGSSATVGVTVGLSGRSQLGLVVTDGGNGNVDDHADWAGARFVCGGTSSPPVISAISATGVTATGATINWTTDVPADTQVEYGVTTAYGTLTPLQTTLATAHQVTLSGLTAGTLYHYRVRSRDAEAELVVSGDNTFTTTAAGPANRPPVPTITSPTPSLTYKVGDVVGYAGFASDDEDGVVPGSSLSWSIVIHHCPGGACHNHFLTSSTGASGSFAVPDHGDASYFELILTATDSAGASGAASVTIHPRNVQITLDTVPTGLTVVYGSLSGTSPMIRTSIVGSLQTISTPSPQKGLTFSSWSDGGAQQHNIIVGDSNAVFTATFLASDLTAPVISGVSSTATATTATVVWTTNEPADEQVEYGLTTAYGTKTPVFTTLRMAHNVIISGLQPATRYRYRVYSRDAAGNLAISGSFSFRTRTK